MAPKTHEGFLAEQHMVIPPVVTVVVDESWALGCGLQKRGEGERAGSSIPGYELLWNTDLTNLAMAFADKYDVIEDWVTYSHTNNLSYPPSSKDDEDCLEVWDPSEDCRCRQRCTLLDDVRG
ncbi:hypothetical protein ARMGADRAFT_1084726 [Armillaria gallica]|uniref:Uncharacterized protein n=1 Tax=Armillaria gallica TaxID=47427 RepID=A0A2H3DBZ6_ARMGA|nr:hypothetical protein ARMGADRAFT_1084726 [Armillaria gallica]